MDYLRNELFELIKNNDSIFNSIQETSLDAIWYWDLENIENKWMNSKLWNTLGYDTLKKTHLVPSWQKIIHKDDLKLVIENATDKTNNAAQSYDQVVRYFHKEGHTVLIRWKGTVIRDNKGKPIRMLGSHTCIGKLKESEENLQKQVNRYRRIIEGSGMGTWEWNVQTGEAVFNERWANILGYTLSELEPVSVETWIQFVHPDDLEKFNQVFKNKIVEKPSFCEYEFRMKHKNGQWIWGLNKGKIVSWTNDGQPEWMSGVLQDIVKQKTVEEGLRSNEQKLKRIYNSTSDSQFLLEVEKENHYKFVSVNHSFLQVNNLTEELVLNQNAEKILSKSNLNVTLKKCSEAIESGKTVQWEEVSVSPTGAKTCIVSITPIFDTDDKCIQLAGTVCDITERKKAEKNLLLFFDRLQLVTHSAKVGVWDWDIVNNVLDWDETMYQIYGVEKEKFKGVYEAWAASVHPEDIIKIEEEVHMALKGASTLDIDFRVIWQDKSVHNIKAKAIVLHDSLGTPVRMVGANWDITELKKAEEGLIEEKNRFQNLVENIPGVYWINDIETHTILYISPSYERVWGRSCEDLYKNSSDFINAIYPEDKPKLFNVHENISNTAGTDITYRILKPDGETRWIEAHIKVAIDKAGKKMEYGYAEDITEQKKVLQAMAESENHLRTIVQTEPECIKQLDSEGKLIYMNPAGLAMIEAESLDMVKNKCVLGVVSPKYRRAFSNVTKNVFKGKIGRLEFELIGLKGTRRWMETHAVPMRDVNGTIISLLAVTRDITERKKAEDGLFTSLKETSDYKYALDHSALVSITDQKGTITHVNDIFCEVSNYKREELLGKKYRILDSGHQPKEFFNEMYATIQSGKVWHGEIKNKTKDGRFYWVDASITPFINKMGKPYQFLTIWYDITLQKNAQQKLQETLAKLEGLLDASTQVSIIGMNTDGFITTLNKGSENLLGYTKSEMISQKYSELIHVKEEVTKREKELSLLLGEKTKGFDVFVALANKGNYETREWTYLRKDGTKFPVQLTITAIKDKGLIIGYLGVAANINEIKKVESEIKLLLNVTKDQNERLRNFAHIVSHNLRSHSGNFSMLLDLLINENPNMKKNELITLLINSSDKLKETIANLNEVVLINTSLNENLVSLNLNDAIQATVLSVNAIAKEASVTICNEVAPDVNILGINAYLESILLNFITNGIKYRSLERDSFIKLFTSIEQDYIVLNIEDNGIGIDLNVNMTKLFGMYKTFHNNEDARGIGLFITKNQIEAIGGKIEVESKINCGTVFKIYLKYEKN